MENIISAKLLNADRCKDFYKEWGEFACHCYNTDKKYAERVGKSCHKTGHYSGSRGFYFVFEISGPRAMIDQLARHSVGTTMNIQSQRYTDSSGLDWFTPADIMDDAYLKQVWDNHMQLTQSAYKTLEEGLSERYGYTGEKAREQARGVIAMDMYSSGVFGFTIEALENFMSKRLCNRAQEHIRELAKIMRKQIISVLPELGEYLAAPCVRNGVCPEGKMQCQQFKNIFPTKEEFDLMRKHPDYIKLLKTVKEEK